MKGHFFICSQITGGVENALSLHVNIPRTDGRSSDLSFEAVLQEYLQFPMNIFFISSSFLGLLLKTLSFKDPQKKKSQGLRSGDRAGQKTLLIILSSKTLDKACIDIRAMWSVAESC
jgi:hypothetical protein